MLSTLQTTPWAIRLHCLDIMFTSLSSYHLGLAALLDAKQLSAHSAVIAVRAGGPLIAVLAILGEYLGVPFLGDFLYLGVTAAAGELVIHHLILRPLLKVSPFFSLSLGCLFLCLSL